MQLSKAVEGFVIARQAGAYSPSTIEIYKWGLKRLIQCIGDKDVERITSADVTRFFAWLNTEYKPRRKPGAPAPLKPGSVQNAWVAVRSFFNWAVPEFGLNERPDRDAKRPRFQYPEIQPFTANELKALVKACALTAPSNGVKRKTFQKRRGNAARDEALVIILLDTGLRAGELCRLRIQDVKMESGEVFVADFGTGQKTKSRHVYLGHGSVRAVWRYLARREGTQPGDLLFVTERGRGLERYALKLIMARLGKRAGVANVHPHRFRHTFAVQYLRNGGDVFTLQRLLGHSTLEMVRRYVALADTDAQAAHRVASPVDRWQL